MLEKGILKAEEHYVGPLNTWSPNLEEGDLFGVNYNGGQGYGDPIERSRARIEKDLSKGLISAQHAKKAYGYTKTEAGTDRARTKIKERRLKESVLAQQWWRSERKRAANGDVGQVVSETFARSAKLSEKLKDEYLEFWNIKKYPYTETGAADFQATTPTGFYFPQSPQKPYVKKGSKGASK